MSARQTLLDASAVLEALRPQANIALGSTRHEDKAIQDAWTLALDRFRDACAEWVDSGGE
jgi:hypothetical protein